jgi:hypothetical protein
MKSIYSMLVAFAFVVAALLIAGPAVAQTADGVTPADEIVCNPLKDEGITKGLYGLCIAYCTAQDLDEFPKENALMEELPGERLLAAYERKRGPNDPDMPCLVKAVECPCFHHAVCVATAGVGDGCELEIDNVAELFAGRTCADTDR